MRHALRFLPTLAVAGALALLASACGAPEDGEALAVLWQAPDFALVDQTGDTLRTAELEGTTWVAHFFFTNCEGVCPLTTSRMAGLRDSLAADGRLGDEVRLVSISVDPARDTVAAVREYADRFGGSAPSEWAFLTGSPPDAVRKTIEEGFRVTAFHDPTLADTAANYQVGHSPRLQLVDPQGRVRATYDATEPDAMDRLRSDLDELRDRLETADVLLLDVRLADEYRAGHVDGARSVPVADLEDCLERLPRDREVVADTDGSHALADGSHAPRN